MKLIKDWLEKLPDDIMSLVVPKYMFLEGNLLVFFGNFDENCRMKYRANLFIQRCRDKLKRSRSFFVDILAPIEPDLETTMMRAT